MSVHHILWALRHSQLHIRQAGLDGHNTYGDLNSRGRLIGTLDLWSNDLSKPHNGAAIHAFNSSLNYCLSKYPDRAVLLIEMLWDKLYKLHKTPGMGPPHLSALPPELANLTGETAHRHHLDQVLELP